jgi:ATP-dependent Lon protease
MALSRPIDSKVAMTGEITLRGQVLPVGGIKEKVLAAHRAGLKTVILPVRNEADLDDLPEDIQGKMDFRFVSTMDDVLDVALKDSPNGRSRPAGKSKKAAGAKKEAAKGDA